MHINASLSSRAFPADWKNPVIIYIFLFLKLYPYPFPLTTIQALSCLWLANSLSVRHVFNVLPNITSALATISLDLELVSLQNVLLAVTQHWLNTLECNKSILVLYF